MTSGFKLRAAALAAAVSVWAAPAEAQFADFSKMTGAQQNEMFCVETALMKDEDHLYLVDRYVFGDPTSAVAKKGNAVMKASVDACAARFGWDARKRELAQEIGLYSLTGNYFAEELYIEGVEEEEIGAIFAALEKLTADELKSFADESWIDDDAFIRRLNALLAAEKFPDDDEFVVESAHLLMEASVRALLAASDWVRDYIR